MSSEQMERELLELAAKAAGPEYGALLSHGKWDPLTDDGDAFRLAVKLAITVVQYGDSCICETPYGYCLAEEEKEHGKERSATRRCITRAAAQLAKGAEK